MNDLKKYSFINSKIRALISYLIKPAIFKRCVDAKNIYEIFEILKDTRYGFLMEFLNDFDLKSIEKRLIKEDIDIFFNIYKFIPTKTEKEFMFLLLERYEIDNLKIALRLWRKKELVDLDDYMPKRNICFNIDFEKIINAFSLDEIIKVLDNTVYKKVILDSKEFINKSLFYLEISLDIDYYKRLFNTINKLSHLDKKVASKILGIEVDIENINLLIKFKKYYNFKEDISGWFLTGGEFINKEKLKDLYKNVSLDELINKISFGPYKDIKEVFEKNIFFIENFLYEVLLKEVKRILSGFPFTIGTIFGYFILKRKETKNMISLISAKSRNLQKEEILQLLNLS